MTNYIHPQCVKNYNTVRITSSKDGNIVNHQGKTKHLSSYIKEQLGSDSYRDVGMTVFNGQVILFGTRY